MKKFYDCGIDLGTTNSCIAKPNADNTCVIIENSEGSSFTPSVVGINKAGRITVGAKAKRIVNARDSKKEFKRDMGTDAEYTFESSGIKKTPVNLSAEVLGQLKRDFESRFINKVAQDAVITVPAAFSLMQCEATKKAALEAGFRNVILLQEPIAAAIAYGAQPDAKEQYWLVFDYGGGTLDVSIISTKDDHLDNVNNRGDNRMGGKDLDKLLYEKIILPKIQKEYSLPNGFDAISTRRIMEDVENCKKELSTKQEVEFYPENLGEAVDEEGEFVDFSCVVTRKEFENVIRDVILRAVSIARKALTESGIKENEVDRILLVGGSTFVPLVRTELQKEFGIKLDCSLNPMTVVAEGAALFAAGQVITEDEDHEQITKSEYALDIEYEAITALDIENVCGRIIGADGKIKKVKIECIADETSANSIWSSGWSDILDKDTGAFDIDVRICNHNTSNLYKVSAIDDKGSEVELFGYLFEITHKDSALKVLAPPINHAIGVLVNDGRINKVEWFTDKNTKLPIEVKKSFVLDKDLKPTVEDKCEIVIYEGEVENSCNPKANDVVGRIPVYSKYLPRKVNKGTEVEITLAINISRETRISAILPDLGIELFTNQSIEGLGAQLNTMQRLVDLEKEFDSTEHTLDLLRKAGIKLGDLYLRFNRMRKEYDKYLELISSDKDSVNVYIQNFYNLQTEIMRLEIESFRSIKEDDLDQNVRRNENSINQYGSDAQKKELQDLKRQMAEARDPEVKKYIADKIAGLSNYIFNHSFEWLKRNYMLFYDGGLVRYTNNQRAEYWKDKAREAIAKADLQGLRGALIELQKIEIDTVGIENSSTHADLKIK